MSVKDENTAIIAKGGGGGGRGGGGSRSSSSSKSSGSKPSSSPKTSTPKAPKSGVSKAAPGSKVKTSSGKEIQTSAKKPSNTKYARTGGVVGDNGYTPRFNNYGAPEGSVVYYQQHSAFDYLPWIYLFSQDNSPRYSEATIVEPDGKEVVAQPTREGVDGMFIINWILLIVIIAAIFAGIVYGVNKLTSKRKK